MPKGKVQTDTNSKTTLSISNDDLTSWAKLNQDLSVPFVHKLQTKDKKYIYDVNTSRILQVAPVVWDIIDDFGRMNKDEIVSKYSPIYEINNILLAYNTISKFQQQDGLLLARHPKYIKMPYDEKTIRKILTSQLKILILCITNACNFRCSYCIYSGRYTDYRCHSNTMMSWNIAQRAIDYFLCRSKDSECRWISFYGGEPLLNASLMRRCINYAQQKGGKDNISFTFTTNGYLLKDHIAEFLASKEITIVVSLDGPANIHDRNRHLSNGGPTWQQVVDNLRTFLKKYPEYKKNHKMSINVVLAPPTNVLEIQEFFNNCDFLTEHINVTVNFLSNLDSTYMESLDPGSRQVAGKDDLYREFVTNLENGLVNKHPKAVPLKIQTALFQRSFVDLYKRGCSTAAHPYIPDYFCPLSTCIPGSRRLCTSVDGQFYVCERVPQVEEMNIGDVYQGIDISKAQELLEKFVSFAEDDCKFCWCVSNCRADCFGAILKNGRLNKELRRRICAIYRRATHHTMSDICRILEKNPHALDYMEKIIIS